MATRYSLRVIVDANTIDSIPADDNVQKDIDRRSTNVLASQQRLVPVDTGFLKSTLSKKKNETGLGRLIGAFGCDYAADVELGHQNGRRFVPGQPYLRPSIDAAKD